MAAIQLLNNLESTQVRVGQRFQPLVWPKMTLYWIVDMVKPGETLSAIAARCRVSIKRLQTLNRISDPSRLLAVQRLIRGAVN